MWKQYTKINNTIAKEFTIESSQKLNQFKLKTVSKNLENLFYIVCV